MISSMISSLRRDPTTDRHGGFDLLRFRPGPVHPSLGDLVVPSSLRSTISIPNLVRTPDRHSPLQPRTPELKRSASLSLPVAWITGARHRARREQSGSEELLTSRVNTSTLWWTKEELQTRHLLFDNRIGCTAASIHRRDPTTDRHGGFDLLRFRPGPVHPSLGDLVVPSFLRITISIPNLARTPDRHSPLQPRTPEIKRSASLSLPVAWITGARHRARREQSGSEELSTNRLNASTALWWPLAELQISEESLTVSAFIDISCTAASIHRRDPTTDRHGGFDLLRFRPGPVHPSLGDLVVPSFLRITISIPNLARTPDRHSPLQPRTPEIKRSASLSLPVAWITGARHRARREQSGSEELSTNRLNASTALWWTLAELQISEESLTVSAFIDISCTAASIHRRDPTTDRHGGFDLLRFRPGPVHPSLGDLVVPSFLRITISIPNLARTPDRHSPLQPRTPEIKRSASLSLPVAWITGARHRARREQSGSEELSTNRLNASTALWSTLAELQISEESLTVSAFIDISCTAASIHRRDPTTDRHGGFDLLRFRPGPVHPSLGDLVVPSFLRITISIPNLARTPDRHSPLQPRTPEIKRSASLSLPVAWITGARHRARREQSGSEELSTNRLNASTALWSTLAELQISEESLTVSAFIDISCTAASIHRRDPTTDRHGGFDLLRFRPGPVHPSLGDLVVPSFLRITISIPNLARTPDRHSPLQPRTPEIKRSASLSLPVAWITGARHRARREQSGSEELSTNRLNASSALWWTLAELQISEESLTVSAFIDISCTAASIHRRDPTTDRHGGFDLLRFRPGPVHPSLGDLVVPSFLRITISIPNLARTPDRHSPLQPRTPEIKRSASLSLPVAWITGARHRARREQSGSEELSTNRLNASTALWSTLAELQISEESLTVSAFIDISCTAASIHRRDPTTDRHGGFDLLRFRPGPVHPSLGDLVVPSFLRITISIPNLARTPDRHSPLQPRTPEIKRSASLSLPVAWITGARHRARREQSGSEELSTNRLNASTALWSTLAELQISEESLTVSAFIDISCTAASIHRRDPTTDRHGGFDLLRFRPGPVHPSLGDLVVPSFLRITISIPNLARTPDRHSPLQPRTPEIKRSASLSLPVAWITGARHRARREQSGSEELSTNRLNASTALWSTLAELQISEESLTVSAFIDISCTAASIHRRDPTTDRHGGFDLLRFRPGPVHPSLGDLVVPSFLRITISIPNLARTPDRHSPLQPRTPEIKRSASLSLPVAWITGARHRARREQSGSEELSTNRLNASTALWSTLAELQISEESLTVSAFIDISCTAASIHRRDPTTDRHGGFDLLRFRPGPVHPSLGDLVVPSFLRITISIPNLARTPDRHSPLQPRTPEIKRSASLSLPVAWITGARHRARREQSGSEELSTNRLNASTALWSTLAELQISEESLTVSAFIDISCTAASIHRRDPTTDRHGGFDLLRFRPGPVHPSLGDLVVPSFLRITISIPNLARTPDRHSPLQPRTPEIKRSASLSLPVAWITGARHRARREQSGSEELSTNRLNASTALWSTLAELQISEESLTVSAFIDISCTAASIHRRDPTTDRHGGFDLLRFRPGPVHPSLGDLVVPSFLRITISIPNLARTPDRHSPLQPRTPEIKRSASLSLPVAWITGARHRARREQSGSEELSTNRLNASSALWWTLAELQISEESLTVSAFIDISCTAASIHRRDPTTDRHGGFDLLRFRPGPVHPSLGDLVVPSFLRITISIPNLARTPDRHSPLQPRTPEIKRSASLSLPVAWITGARHRARREQSGSEELSTNRLNASTALWWTLAELQISEESLTVSAFIDISCTAASIHRRDPTTDRHGGFDLLRFRPGPVHPSLGDLVVPSFLRITISIPNLARTPDRHSPLQPRTPEIKRSASLSLPVAWITGARHRARREQSGSEELSTNRLNASTALWSTLAELQISEESLTVSAFIDISCTAASIHRRDPTTDRHGGFDLLRFRPGPVHPSLGDLVVPSFLRITISIPNLARTPDRHSPLQPRTPEIKRSASLSLPVAWITGARHRARREQSGSEELSTNRLNASTALWSTLAELQISEESLTVSAFIDISCTAASIHRRDPTTDRHGGFDLLRFRPGPVHPSLGDLVVPSFLRITISIPNLARTPDRHSPLQPRTPEIKRSASLSLPVAWITGARHRARREQSGSEELSTNRLNASTALWWTLAELQISEESLTVSAFIDISCTAASIHRRDPTTDRHGGFDLLRFRPGPVHPSLGDLVVPSFLRITISIPNLARTPDRHSPLQPRTPEIKRSASLSLPVAWITGARHRARREQSGSEELSTNRLNASTALWSTLAELQISEESLTVSAFIDISCTAASIHRRDPTTDRHGGFDLLRFRPGPVHPSLGDLVVPSFLRITISIPNLARTPDRHSPLQPRTPEIKRSASLSLPVAWITGARHRARREQSGSEELSTNRLNASTALWSTLAELQISEESLTVSAFIDISCTAASIHRRDPTTDRHGGFDLLRFRPGPVHPSLGDLVVPSFLRITISIPNLARTPDRHSPLQPRTPEIKRSASLSLPVAWITGARHRARREQSGSEELSTNRLNASTALWWTLAELQISEESLTVSAFIDISCTAASIHRRDPTTDRHGGFDLLRFRPGPVHPSLGDLVVPSFLRITISIPNLARTPDRHSPLQPRTPEIKRSASLSLPVAWITGARHRARREQSGSEELSTNRLNASTALWWTLAELQISEESLTVSAFIDISCTAASIHRRDPTTDRHGGFDLLRFRPGPVHPSLGDLVVPSFLRITISIPNLARTPDRHSPLQPRTPEIKRSASLSLPVAWITGARHRARREQSGSEELSTNRLNASTALWSTLAELQISEESLTVSAFIDISCTAASIHRRDPTTDRHGGFDLLRFRPGPVHPSLGDLVVPSFLRITISIPNLARTPDRHSPLQPRTPEIKRSASLSLPVAWITGARHRARREQSGSEELSTNRLNASSALWWTLAELQISEESLTVSAFIDISCTAASIHRRDPTTDRHGGFDLLRFRPGPVHPSLGDLVVPSFLRITISIPNLARTPDRHSPLQPRTPEIKRSASLSLPVAWITGARHRARREQSGSEELSTNRLNASTALWSTLAELQISEESLTVSAFIDISCTAASIHRRDPTTDRHGGFDLLRFRPGPVHPSLGDLVVPSFLRITISIPNLARTPDRHSPLQPRTPEIKRSASLSLPVAWITGARHRARREQSGSEELSTNRLNASTALWSTLAELQISEESLTVSAFIDISCTAASIHRRDPTTDRHGGFDLLRFRPGPVHPSLGDLVVPSFLRITISIPNLARTPDRHSPLQPRTPEIKRSASLSLPVAWITGARHRARREQSGSEELSTNRLNASTALWWPLAELQISEESLTVSAFIDISCTAASIHRRDPTTDRHGGFDLLRFRPGPVHPSLGDLVVPSFLRITISIPNLARTPDRHSPLQPRTPEIKRSASLSLPVAWITGARHRARREQSGSEELSTNRLNASTALWSTLAELQISEESLTVSAFIDISCTAASIHRRDPTTDRHGGFDLLRFRPGPVHPSLGDLVVPSFLRITISIPNLARTPDRHSPLQPRTPEIKRSASLSLPVAWITGARHRARREQSGSEELSTNRLNASTALWSTLAELQISEESLTVSAFIDISCTAASIHRRDPTTDRHGGFDLLRFRPGPVHPSLGDLVVPSFLRITISIPNLARTPDRHSPLQPRTPEIKRSASLSLPVAWITGARHRARREQSGSEELSTNRLNASTALWSTLAELQISEESLTVSAFIDISCTAASIHRRDPTTDRHGGFDLLRFRPGPVHPSLGDLVVPSFLRITISIPNLARTPDRHSPLQPRTPEIKRSASLSLPVAWITGARHRARREQSGSEELSTNRLNASTALWSTLAELQISEESLTVSAFIDISCTAASIHRRDPTTDRHGGFDLLRFRPGPVHPSLGDLVVPSFLRITISIPNLARTPDRHSPLQPRTPEIKRSASLSLPVAWITGARHRARREQSGSEELSTNRLNASTALWSTLAELQISEESLTVSAFIDISCTAASIHRRDPTTDRHGGFDLLRFRPGPVHPSLGDLVVPSFLRITISIPNLARTPDRHSPLQPRTPEIKRSASLSLPVAWITGARHRARREQSGSEELSTNRLNASTALWSTLAELQISEESLTVSAFIDISCTAASIHRRDPTTDRHGGFDLLRFRPGPVHPSLGDLVVPSFLRITISIPNLARTPDRHSPLQPRTPEIKRSASLSLPVAWITGARHRARREQSGSEELSTNRLNASTALWSTLAELQISEESLTVSAFIDISCTAASIHRRDPTTDRHGGFDLLRFRPGPVHPSLGDLVVPSFLRITISIPNLARTPDRHSPLQPRTPEIKRSASLSLPVAWITGARHRARREQSGSEELSTNRLNASTALWWTLAELQISEESLTVSAFIDISCTAASIHRRDPTTDRHGGFDLLRFRPGPVHPSLGDLVVPSFLRITISIPNLARTPDRHSPLQPRTPEIKRSASLSLPVAWITGARHRARREQSGSEELSTNRLNASTALWWTLAELQISEESLTVSAFIDISCTAASIHRRDPTTDRHGGFDLLRFRPGPVHPSLGDLVVPSFLRITISIPNLARTPDRHSPLQPRTPEIKRSASLSLPVAWITGARHRARREQSGSEELSTNRLNASTALWSTLAELQISEESLTVSAFIDISCTAASIHRRDPTTDRHGGFDLLRFRPGPVHPSLGDLVVPSFLRITISIPNLARTPDRHSPLQPRTPEIKRSASLSLPVAWITGARHRARREQSGSEELSTNRLNASTALWWTLAELQISEESLTVSAFIDISDLVVPSFLRITISIPNLARTPDRHSPLQPRTPEIKRSASLSLPVAWITGARHRARREQSGSEELSTNRLNASTALWSTLAELQISEESLTVSAFIDISCTAASIHRRDPTTDRHGGFDLLRFRPGPVHPSLGDLVVPSFLRITISIPNLARTPDRHSPLQPRTPEIKRSASLSLPVAWITGARHRARREQSGSEELSTNRLNASTALWSTLAELQISEESLTVSAFIDISCTAASIHRRDPTTDRHGGFDLLRFRPGPVHPSLGDLVVPSFLRITISIPNLARTPDRHSPLQPRTPEIKRSASLSLPVAWITGARHRARREQSGSEELSTNRLNASTALWSTLAELQISEESLTVSAFIDISCTAASIHRRDPTTDRHGGFDLLRFRPGPVHPSLGDLVVPSFLRITISIPNLARTPDRHSPLQPRTPEIKRSASLSLPVAWITGARHRARREQSGSEELSTNRLNASTALWSTLAELQISEESLTVSAFIDISCTAASIHRRDPTTDRHGGFDLLRFRPGPVHPSLGDLVVPSFLRITISIPNLARTPDRHSPLQPRTPEIKRSASLSLPVAWITGARHRARREQSGSEELSTNRLNASTALWSTLAELQISEESLTVSAFIDISCTAASIHRRDPTTDRHGGFDLLRFRPGPVHPSLGDLVVPSFLRITISIPNLARTPDRHSPLQPRTPEIKRSASLSLPVAWITGARHRARREQSGSEELSTNRLNASTALWSTLAELQISEESLTVSAFIDISCTAASIHRRDPTTDRHGGFDLLRFRPGPVHPSLGDLVVPSFLRITISIPNLARTPDRHSPLQPRTPEIKRSASLSLPVAWITGARHRARREQSGSEELSTNRLNASTALWSTLAELQISEESLTVSAFIDISCTAASIHRRDPTTDRHGGFDLLRFRPGPVHPSLGDLVVPSFLRITISIPNLARTPDRHSPLQPRTPEIKRSASLSLPVAWITGARHRARREQSGSEELSTNRLNTSTALWWTLAELQISEESLTVSAFIDISCTAASIHRRDPTTDRHGGFDLLRFRPGPVHPSLGDLVVPSFLRITISIPNLARTPNRHSPLQPRTPEIKRSASLSLPVAWITGARHRARREQSGSEELSTNRLNASTALWWTLAELQISEESLTVSAFIDISCTAASIHRRDPTTDRHGGFDLLRFRPGPVHPSLGDLVVPSSLRITISIPNLARTPDRHSPLQPRTPEIKRSASLSLPVAWITGARHRARREQSGSEELSTNRLNTSTALWWTLAELQISEESLTVSAFIDIKGNKQFMVGDVVVKVGSTLCSCFLQLYRIIFRIVQNPMFGSFRHAGGVLFDLYRIIFRIVQNPMLDHFVMLAVLFDVSTLMSQTFQGVTVRTDFFIVFMSLLDIILSLVQSVGGISSRQASTLFRVLKILKGARVFRTLFLLRAIRFFKGLQAILLTSPQSFRSMSSIIVLMFLFLFIFAVIFQEMFNESDPEHFGNILIYMTSRDNAKSLTSR
ncbi:hypothetical protein AOLI_G00151400 [Acnodon oligacanthus]